MHRRTSDTFPIGINVIRKQIQPYFIAMRSYNIIMLNNIMITGVYTRRFHFYLLYVADVFNDTFIRVTLF